MYTVKNKITSCGFSDKNAILKKLYDRYSEIN